jgi:hypothetical protein
VPENVAGVLAAVAPVAGAGPNPGDNAGVLAPVQPAKAAPRGWQLQLADSSAGDVEGGDAGGFDLATAGTVAHA